MRNNLVIVDETKFIFNTNFSGDPKRDRFGNDQRKGNLIIPNEEQALDLLDEGFNVKQTRPRPGEEEGFIPRYYVPIKANYDSQWPPKVYLVTDDNKAVLLDSDTVGCIDDMWIEKVNVVLNQYEGPNGKSLYVKSMEVFQKVDDDPISSKYRTQNMEEEIPFE